MAKRWLLGSLMLSLALLAPMALPAPRAWAGDDAAAATANADDKHVEIHMADGRIIKGELVSETASEYVVLATLMEGFPAVETTLKKSLVTQIIRGAGETEGTGAPTPKADPGTGDRPAKGTDDKPQVAEGAAKIILTRVDGETGFEFSKTPLIKFFELVDEQFNDIGADGHVVSEHRQDHIVVFRLNSQTNVDQGLTGMFSIMDLKQIIDDQINKGRRIVFWVEKGLNGAAILPMMSPEIFFTERGILYVTDDMEDFSFGDPVVREKQISLRIVHAEGFPIRGGYREVGPPLVDAMVRRTYEFWYKKVGDKVVASTQPPPADEIDQWIQLSDNGTGDNKDDPDDITKLRGNDRVWLDADRAYELGISKGVANTLDDIAFHLGVSRNYVQIAKGDGEEVFHRWGGELNRALAQVATGQDGRRPRGEMWRDFDKADELPTASARLGRRKVLLEKIRGIYRKYHEALDPEGQFESQLNVEIERLKQQIRQVNSSNM